MASSEPIPPTGDAPQQPATESQSPTPDAEEPLRTPPQFSLKGLLLAGVGFALLCSLLKIIGAEMVFPLLMLAMLAWLIVGVSRLLASSRKEASAGERPPGEDVRESSANPMMDQLRHLAEVTAYPVDAYLFVLRGLEFAQEWVRSRPSVVDEHGRHVDAVDLCWCLRDLALMEFGSRAQAGAWLAAWNVHHCEDFGKIVYHLIDAGLARQSQEDSIEDFAGVYDFEKEFGAKIGL